MFRSRKSRYLGNRWTDLAEILCALRFWRFVCACKFWAHSAQWFPRYRDLRDRNIYDIDLRNRLNYTRLYLRISASRLFLFSLALSVLHEQEFFLICASSWWNQPMIYPVKSAIWILRGVVALYQVKSFLTSQLTLQCFPQQQTWHDTRCREYINSCIHVVGETL